MALPCPSASEPFPFGMPVFSCWEFIVKGGASFVPAKANP